MSIEKLFRPESLEARQQAWLGRPTVLRHLPVSLFAWFSAALLVALVLFLTFGEYTRRVRVSGVILPVEGLTRLAAPQSGWVTDLKVQEGDAVRRGEVLYTLSVDLTTSLGNTQDAVLDLLREKRGELVAALERQAGIDAVERRMIEQQIADLGAELPEVEEQLRLLQESTSQLEDFTTRQEDLMARGFTVSREYESRLQAFNAERAQLPRLRRERVQLEARRKELQVRLSGFDLEAGARSAEIRRQMIDIEQQISEGEARRELRVTAPRDGTVTGIMTLAGQTVAPGTPLLTIVPTDRPLVAQLLAPSSAIGFVREGAQVLLRYEAFPYQKFGQYPARVSVISRANLGPEEMAHLNPAGFETRAAPTVYRITVEPEMDFVNAYGQREALQAGMQVEAHLLLETRPLYQWILEPLYGLRGALTSSRQAS